MNPLFKGVQSNDPKDLVNFIIMTLHEELNKVSKNQNKNNNNILIDQTNNQLILNNFISDFAKENRSIISDLFYGINITINRCSYCVVTKYNYQSYSFLIFPLEEVRKLKMEILTNQFLLMNQNMFNMNLMLFQQNLFDFQSQLEKNKIVDINDCFLYNQKMEEKSIFCNRCKIICSSSHCTKLYTTPQILIIYFHREQKDDLIKIEFDENLNLSNFIELKQAGYIYKLIGIVTILKGNDSNEKIIAYCKSPIDCKWYKYNDDIVIKVYNFKEEVIDNAIPYILIFQKNEINY